MLARIRSTCDGDLETPRSPAMTVLLRAVRMQLRGDGEPCKWLTANRQKVAALQAANQQRKHFLYTLPAVRMCMQSLYRIQTLKLCWESVEHTPCSAAFWLTEVLYSGSGVSDSQERPLPPHICPPPPPAPPTLPPHTGICTIASPTTHLSPSLPLPGLVGRLRDDSLLGRLWLLYAGLSCPFSCM